MKQETTKHLVPGWQNKIRAARAERNITMLKISEKLNVSIDTIARVFRGTEDASFEIAFQISEYLNTPLLTNRKSATNKKIVYVGSRYAGDKSANIALNQAYCRGVMEEGHLPLSSHLTLAYLDEETERETALELCKNLIDISDEVRLYLEFGKSPGMELEEEYARSIGKPIIYVE